MVQAQGSITQEVGQGLQAMAGVGATAPWSATTRNARAFLLQTYRRDMGGGEFVVMKEAAAPITVNGRHWGGLRLAFKF